MCRRIYQHKANNRAFASRLLPDEIRFGWVHEEGGVEQTLCDTSGDYNCYIGMSESLTHMNYVRGKLYYWRYGSGNGGDVNSRMQSKAVLVMSNTDYSTIVLILLNETAVFSSSELRKILVEMRS